MSTNTQTPGALFREACPPGQILCSPPRGQAAAAPLSQILRSAAPSPRPQTTPAPPPPPVGERYRTPPPKRDPKRKAPENLHFNSAKSLARSRFQVLYRPQYLSPSFRDPPVYRGYVYHSCRVLFALRTSFDPFITVFCPSKLMEPFRENQLLDIRLIGSARSRAGSQNLKFQKTSLLSSRFGMLLNATSNFKFLKA
jgi:hypothetical protein